MFKNYIKIAWRNLLNSKGFSFINITGLAIGMAAALLIGLWIRNEVSFDRFHERIDNIYLAYNRAVFEGEIRAWNTTPVPLGPALKQEYPEIKYSVRTDYSETHLIEYNGKKINGEGFDADADFLKMFSFPLLYGNVDNALNGVDHIVVTEDFAKKLFGSGAQAMGKVIKYDNKHNFTIAGIIEQFPSNTRFSGDFITPWAFFRTQYAADERNWGNNSYRTFIELKPGTNIEQLNKKIRTITRRHSNGDEDNDVFLYAFGQNYLHNQFINGKPVGGRIDVIRMFSFIAGFILLIACINFMNLSTARSEHRAKEVGVRKAIGAMKKSLVSQFLFESFFITLIAGVISLVIAQYGLPYFNQITQRELSMPFTDGEFWASVLGFILFTALLAGIYPALYLSSFKPVEVLKGTFTSVNAIITPRKLLVLLQFTFAVVMIICTIVIRRQIQYAQDRDSGYDKSNLIYTYFSGDIQKNKHLIKRELLNSGVADVVSITSGSFVTSSANSWGLDWHGKPANAKIVFDQLGTLGNFTSVLNVKMLAGRDINPDAFPTDSTACLINESAARAMNFKNPIGEIIDKDFIKWHVVGVFKDFLWGSPYEPMRPMFVMGPAEQWSNVINFRLNSHKPMHESMKQAEAIFRKYNPAFPVDLQFVDENYKLKFEDQQRTARLAGTFALLTIVISCLGLFGLAAYMAASRTKEIGVRKVLGASVLSITTMLSKDFLKLVFAAIVIATPIAWYAMNRWLQEYSYRIEVEWWVFALAGLGAILIAVLTVSFQSVKAAIANPVKSLRSE